MKTLLTTTAGVLGALLIATSANAAIVCNANGDCWRVKEKYTYPDSAQLEIYDDKWQWGDGAAKEKEYRWRDAGVGRGYWGPDGVWITF
jgi:hypothetical protein